MPLEYEPTPIADSDSEPQSIHTFGWGMFVGVLVGILIATVCWHPMLSMAASQWLGTWWHDYHLFVPLIVTLLLAALGVIELFRRDGNYFVMGLYMAPFATVLGLCLMLVYSR